MPKLQRNNDDSLLKSQYIYCIKRPNRPRINVLICELCKYNKKCANYQAFKKGLPIEDVNSFSWKITTVKKKKAKRVVKKRKSKK